MQWVQQLLKFSALWAADETAEAVLLLLHAG